MTSIRPAFHMPTVRVIIDWPTSYYVCLAYRTGGARSAFEDHTRDYGKSCPVGKSGNSVKRAVGT